MRIVHIADLHLGFRSYHRVNPQGANAREVDVASAFDQAIDRTIELQPDLTLIAGDIFHVVRPSNAAINDAFRQFSRLRAGLPRTPIVMIAGNHDSPRMNDTGNILTLFQEIPGIVVASARAQQVHIKSLDTSVLCLPYNALVAGSAALEPDPKARHNILMLHGTVGGESAQGKLRYIQEFGTVDIEDTSIRPERWDYVALGHYHILTELAPNMWYPGAIERTSSNIWLETGPKGFLLFDTTSKKAEFHELNTRPVIDLPELDANGLDATQIDERIQTTISSIQGGIDGKIIRLVISNAPRHVLRELNQQQLREYRTKALHFQLDARSPKKQAAGIATGGENSRQSLPERINEFLKKEWQPSSGHIRPEKLIELAQKYHDSSAPGS